MLIYLNPTTAAIPKIAELGKDCWLIWLKLHNIIKSGLLLSLCSCYKTVPYVVLHKYTINSDASLMKRCLVLNHVYGTFLRKLNNVKTTQKQAKSHFCQLSMNVFSIMLVMGWMLLELKSLAMLTSGSYIVCILMRRLTRAAYPSGLAWRCLELALGYRWLLGAI